MNTNDILKNHQWINKYKVYIPMACAGGGDFPNDILTKPILGDKNSCCSETYLLVGPFNTEQTAKNVQSYMTTKFFRFLVMLKKISQHASTKVYQCVPMQDFNETWTDEKLYKKYGLTIDEINFIESMIKPMGI